MYAWFSTAHDVGNCKSYHQMLILYIIGNNARLKNYGYYNYKNQI